MVSGEAPGEMPLLARKSEPPGVYLASEKAVAERRLCYNFDSQETTIFPAEYAPSIPVLYAGRRPE
jgi:hypothetical protein